MTWKVRLRRAQGLRRFVRAQNRQDPRSASGFSFFEQAMNELRSGGKTSHWMWFIFPQAYNEWEGASENNLVYGLTEGEAERYLRHPQLGLRLREGFDTVKLQLRRGNTVRGLFGDVDARKFISCVDLFAKVSPVEFGDFKKQLAVTIVVNRHIRKKRMQENADHDTNLKLADDPTKGVGK